MSSLNVEALVSGQLEKALASELRQAADAPVPVTGDVAIPARAEPAAPAAAPTAPVADDRYDKLMALVEAQTKELAALKKGLKAPAPAETAQTTRPTVKSVEQQVEELRNRLERTDELRVIERELPTVPEYGTLKTIPELADLVRTTIREEKRAARERGEGDIQVSVASAVKKIKQTYVESLKQHLANEALLKEIGLSAPAPATPANSGRAMTPDLTSNGATTVKTEAKSFDQLVKMQVERALRAVSG